MKKIAYVPFVCFLFIVLQSCTTNELERSKLKRFKEIMKSVDDKNKYPGGLIVPQDLAEECIAKYDSIYKTVQDTAAIKYAYTNNVAFGVNGLVNWMMDMADKTNVDNVRIFYGVYTERMAAAYPNKNIEVGRLTMFLWPYRNNEKAVYTNLLGAPDDPDTTEPFNLGNVQP